MGDALEGSGLPVLEPLRAIRRLGAGAMGEVFEAQDRRSGARVAVKMLLSAAPESIRRFKAEFRSLRDVRHPNLVRLGELFESDGRWFFTMEMVDGTDLLGFVRPRPDVSFTADTLPGHAMPVAWDDRRLRSALRQLSEGLAALHAAGKLHRDIKPSNIRVDSTGRVVLLDFGLVSELDAAQSIEHGVVGTVFYMAPEQGAGLPLTPAADWYAVGVMLYEALTGRLPFEGRGIDVLAQKLQREPVAPRRIDPTIPVDLDDLCTSLLRTDPERRATADDVLRALGGVETTARARIAAESVFFGRTAELRTLELAFAEALAGNANAVAVEGESGVGKSTLVRELCTRVGETHREALILVGRCYEREAVPFRGFDSIVDALSKHLRQLDQVDAALLLPRDVALLARVFPSLQKVPAVQRASLHFSEAAADPGGLGVQAPQRRAFLAMRELLARIGERTPLLIWIDDYQWTDPDSLALLDEVTAGPDTPRMLLVVTRRTKASAGRAAAATSLGTLPTRRIQLGGLPPLEGAELASALCQQYGVASVDGDAVARKVDGHPYLLGELVRYLAAGSIAADSARVEDALLYRVRQLDELPLRLLSIIAVAGTPIATGLALAAAGIPPESATGAVSVLYDDLFVRSDHVDAIECYHDRVREAVCSLLSTDEQLRCHGLIAAELEKADPSHRDPHDVVRHLLASGQGKKAAAVAVEAARLAIATLAFERAIALLRLALGVDDLGPHERFELTAMIAAAFSGAGRSSEAADAYLRASVSAPTEAIRNDLKRLAFEHLAIGGHLERGLRDMEDIVQESGLDMPGTIRASLASLLRQRSMLRRRGLRWTQREDSQVPLATRKALDVHKAVAMGLGTIDHVRGALSNAKALRLALDCGTRSHVARTLAVEVVYEASEGDPAGWVKRLRTELRRIADGGSDLYIHGLAAMVDGCIHYFHGRDREAVGDLVSAERFLGPVPGATWELNITRMFRMMALHREGMMKRLGEEFDLYREDASRRGDRLAENTILRAMNICWLVRDDPTRAFDDLQRTSSLLATSDHVDLQDLLDLNARIDIALYLGEGHLIAASRRAVLEALRRSPLMKLPARSTSLDFAHGRSALAELEHGRSADARRVVRACARRLRATDLGYALVWAEILDAGLHANADDLESAATSLRTAVKLAKKHGAVLCHAVANRRLGEITGGSAGESLMADADRWMRDQSIASPSSFANMLTPGFTS